MLPLWSCCHMRAPKAAPRYSLQRLRSKQNRRMCSVATVMSLQRTASTVHDLRSFCCKLVMYIFLQL
uniref:Uncharacterized protein n=1 Tax=Arundo donax TaxID=35708 RepID=A0A0A9FJY5_ARUDO